MYMKKYCIMLWIDLNNKKSRFSGLFIIQRIAKLRRITPFLHNGGRWDTVAGALRRKLHGCYRFTEVCCPCVKVLEAVILQRLRLQIPLHGVQLHHTVGNGRSGGKHNAMPICQLVEILAFEIHIAGLLGFRLGNARHVLHFTYCGEIFV